MICVAVINCSSQLFFSTDYNRRFLLHLSQNLKVTYISLDAPHFYKHIQNILHPLSADRHHRPHHAIYDKDQRTSFLQIQLIVRAHGQIPLTAQISR